MLAAAGGASVDPHELSAPAVRARWNRDLAQWKRDLPLVQQFLLDVAEGRLTNTDSIAVAAAPFWGDAQSAWYTVGYMVGKTVEENRGRDFLRGLVCDRSALLAAYNSIARERGLPVWNEELIRLLARD